MTILALILLLLALILIGVPIGFVLTLIGSLGLFLISGPDVLVSILSSTVYRSVNNFTFTTIPLFILMAHFISKSGIADDLFDTMLKWIGHLPGGAGVATVLASAGFGALSGSSIAATSTMSQIAVPQMIRANYSDKFATGLVATCTGTLAVLIPPSIPLVIYGIQTETSIGKLLIAGVIPGIFLTTTLCIVVVITSMKSNSKVDKASWSERWSSLGPLLPTVILISLVLAVLYSGIATSTEVAAFGAFGALVIGLVLKRLSISSIYQALVSTTKQTAMIFLIIIGANIFATYIAMSRVGFLMVNWVVDSGLSAPVILLLIIIAYLVLGMFLDLIATLLITLPLVFPLIIELGYDPIWFGVLVVILLEIGLVTPPTGLNLFIVSEHSKVPVEKVFMGSVPFIVVLLFCILVMVLVPELATYLPSKM